MHLFSGVLQVNFNLYSVENADIYYRTLSLDAKLNIGSSRLRQRRGQIAGLHNFGQTCFLNTLLQALAACPQFIAWLQLYNNANSDRKSLISSLLSTLEVINGTHSTLRGDPYSPGAVMRALHALGWVIPQEEHDAHELFHVLLASLEEEALRPKKVGCLSDALPLTVSGGEGDQPDRPSSAMLTDFLNTDYDESTNLMRMVRSEAHTPDSPSSVCEREMCPGEGGAAGTSPTEIMDFDPLASPILGGERSSRSRKIQLTKHGWPEGLNKRVSTSCRSLERLSRGPGRVSVNTKHRKYTLQNNKFLLKYSLLDLVRSNASSSCNTLSRRYGYTNRL